MRKDMSDSRLPVADCRRKNWRGKCQFAVGHQQLAVKPTWFLLLALCLFALPSFCTAQTLSPRDEILRLVPPDTGVCLVLTDLRGHWPKVWETGWIKSL